MKRFNVTGPCLPEQHYMCDISSKVSQIMAMIERSEYFTINRARQYGKTAIHNRIFEIGITNYFVTEKETSDSELTISILHRV